MTNYALCNFRFMRQETFATKLKEPTIVIRFIDASTATSFMFKKIWQLVSNLTKNTRNDPLRCNGISLNFSTEK